MLCPVFTQLSGLLPRGTRSCGFRNFLAQRRNLSTERSDGLAGFQVLRPPFSCLRRCSCSGLPELRLLVLLFGLARDQMGSQLVLLGGDPFLFAVGRLLFDRRDRCDVAPQLRRPVCQPYRGWHVVRKECQVLGRRELTDQGLESFAGISMIGGLLAAIQRHHLQRTSGAGPVVLPATQLQRFIVDLDSHRATHGAEQFQLLRGRAKQNRGDQSVQLFCLIGPGNVNYVQAAGQSLNSEIVLTTKLVDLQLIDNHGPLPC